MSALGSDRNPIEQLAEDFADRFRRGERPSLAEYVAQYPDLADDIRELFPALVAMEQLKPATGDLTGDFNGAAHLDLPPRQHLGDYRLLRTVGRGGMGVVYEAEQVSLGRHVALKVLPGSSLLNPTFRERFRREAKAAARLHHTNIVPVYGVGEADGYHFYAMQFIAGQGLDDVLQDLRRWQEQPSALGTGMTDGSMAEGLLSGRFDSAGTAEPLAPASAGPATELATADESAALGSSALAESSVSLSSGCASAAYCRSVARLGEQVADALSYAHRQGILHRDIKPSNLLLDAQGTVWVTDFGLAKETGAGEAAGNLTVAGDIVGTIRYMAPERFDGGSLPQSDIYSLGLTLYELLTLRPAFDDSSRPKLIERVLHQPPVAPRQIDPRIPRDLETIVLKCLAKEPSERYATAQSLAEDLRRFQADRPILARRSNVVERFWRWCRRNPAIASLLAAVTASLVLGTAASAWFAIEADAHARQAYANEKNALDQKAQADDARHEATESLWKAYQDQARAGRFSGLVGRRLQGLDALKKAAEIRPSLEIRNEAIACLAHADLTIIRQFEGYPTGSKGYGFDAKLERYARGDSEGNISIRRLADDKEVLRLKGSGIHAVILLFSPDGNFLAVKYHNDDRMYVSVWDLRGPKEVLHVPSGISERAMAFSGDSGRVAYGQRKGGIGLFDLSRGQHEKSLPSPIPNHLAFSPDGSKLAVSVPSQNMIQTREISSGKLLNTFLHPSMTIGLDWSPDAKFLAVACDNGSIHLWHYPTLRRTAVLTGHQLRVTQVNFNHAGDLLVTRSHDGTTRLWNPVTGQQLLSAPGGYMQISQDDSCLAFVNVTQVGIWQIHAARECRSLPGHKSFAGNVAISNDGRVLASAGADGVRFWDLATWKELPGLPIGLTRSALFTPDGKSLITCGKRGVERWALRTSAGQDEHDLRIGPPQPLGSLGSPSVEQGGFLSPDGKTLAVIRTVGQCIVFDLDKMRPKFVLDGHLRVVHAAFSPNGQFIATGTWQGKDIKVWKATSGELVATLPTPDTSHALFTPDGKSLITCAAEGFQYWDVGTWQAGRRLSRALAGNLPGTGAFTKDGKLLAVVHSQEALHLVHPEKEKIVATLEFPLSRNRLLHGFSPDGSLLVTTDHTGAIQVWDLRLIRRQLKEMNLDWDLPEYQPSSANSRPTLGNPLTVKIDYGSLAATADRLPAGAVEKLRVQHLLYTLQIAGYPWHPEPYHLRGHVHEKLGEPQHAVDDFSAALIWQPHVPLKVSHLLHARATNHLRLQEAELGMTDLRRAVEINPNDLVARNSLAWFCVTGPEAFRDAHQALPHAQLAVQRAPKNALFANTLGVVQYRLGKWQEAVATLEKSMALDKSRHDAHNLFVLSMCHVQLGSNAKAQDCFDRAVQWWEKQNNLPAQHIEELMAFRAEAEGLLQGK